MDIPKNIKKNLNGFNGRIITRFPPEPSGCLHLGHAKAIFINYSIAKYYNGKFILRFDDTNPEKESLEYVNQIIKDITSLDVIPDKITHTSDYFDKIIECADFLVDNFLAYVDDTDSYTMGLERKDRIDSKNRDLDSRELWNQMKSGTITNSVLRIKLNMKSNNGAMRDPTIFRFNILPHFATGKKYCVYPTYDFACPIVDTIEGVTHVYRSCEFVDRDEQYQIILKMLNFSKIILSGYGKLNFTDAIMSKRAIKAMIDADEVDGWNDPRLLTLQGAFRRGLSLPAIRMFVSELGFSKNTNNKMEQDTLWKINRKVIDKIATRYTVLPLLEITTKSFPETCYINDSVLINRIDRYPDAGKRNLYYSRTLMFSTNDVKDIGTNEEVTLMNFGNVFFGEYLVTNPGGDFKNTKHKLLWLCYREDYPVVNVRIISYQSGKKIITKYFGEPDMKYIKVGDYVQLMKMGYYICDYINDDIIELIEMIV